MRTNTIFKQLAREQGITTREVREEIQKAITEAWMHSQKDSVTAACQRQVPCRGDIPTPEELIHYLALKIQQQTNDSK